MFRCKASGALRNEAYNGYAAVTKKPDNAADGRFPAPSLEALDQLVY